MMLLTDILYLDCHNALFSDIAAALARPETSPVHIRDDKTTLETGISFEIEGSE
jgi:hypothetical protein